MWLYLHVKLSFREKEAVDSFYSGLYRQPCRLLTDCTAPIVCSSLSFTDIFLKRTGAAAVPVQFESTETETAILKKKTKKKTDHLCSMLG